MAFSRRAVVEDQVECPASVAGYVIERCQMDRAGKLRSVNNDRVVLTMFAAWIGSCRHEIGEELQRERPAQPRRGKHTIADRDEARIRTSHDELAIESSRRLSPERLDGRQTAGSAHALRELAVRVVHDVAEDHMRDPERTRVGESLQIALLVACPRSATRTD